MTRPDQSARPRILYVDDDEGLAHLAIRHLGRAGFDVTHAASGEAALKLLVDQMFDLIALDHEMPGQDGLTVLGEIRRLADPPPVIFVTGSDDATLAVAAIKSGAMDFVIKAAGGGFFELLESASRQTLDAAELRAERRAAERRLREANEQLQKHVEQQSMLIKEINHRVANSLQIVGALVRMQSSAIDNDEAKAVLLDTQQRIAAIARVHRRLYTTADVHSVELGRYLEELVDEIKASLTDVSQTHEIVHHFDDVAVSTDKAVSVGIILAELLTNAVKYAYPERDGGEIRVRLSRVDESSVQLAVEDDGVGLLEPHSKSSGLGRQVVKAMAASLKTSVELDKAHQGCRFLMTFTV